MESMTGASQRGQFILMSDDQIKKITVVGDNGSVQLAKNKLVEDGYVIIEQKETADGTVLTAKKNSPPPRAGIQFVD